MERFDNIYLKHLVVFTSLFTVTELIRTNLIVGSVFLLVIGTLILKHFNTVDFYDCKLTIQERRIKDLEKLLGRKEEINYTDNKEDGT